jgi:hypothetical protein
VPTRSAHARRSRAFALALLLLIAGCGSNELDHDSADDPKPTDETTSRPAPTSTTTTTTDPGAEELAARLPTTVPDGFVQEDDDVGDTGPSDLEKAVRDDASDGAQEALVAEGFVRGYQRLWTNPEGDELIDFVYQFDTPEGAAADWSRQKANVEAEPTEGVNPYTPSGLDPQSSYAYAGTNGGSSFAIVATTKGVYHVQVVASGEGTDVELMKSRASALMAEQLARL